MLSFFYLSKNLPTITSKKKDYYKSSNTFHSIHSLYGTESNFLTELNYFVPTNEIIKKRLLNILYDEVLYQDHSIGVYIKYKYHQNHA